MTTSFVGREAELDALRGALEDAQAARPRLVLIDGVAGIGKTALIDRFLALVSAVRIIRVSGDETEAQLPFAVIDQLLRQAGATEAGMLGDSLHLSSIGDHFNAGARVIDVLGSLQESVPLVLIVDDAQWVDAQSLRALLFALRRLAVDRVLTLMAVRSTDTMHLPEGLRRLASQDAGMCITIGPLDADQVRRVADGMGLRLSVRAARRLTEHTEGNPLYARELLVELPDEVMQAGDGPLPAPHSFEDVVGRRIAGCSAEARSLVEAAAVLGLRCSLDAAARVGEVTDPVVALHEAVTARLLEIREPSVGLSVGFPHPLVQAAVYQRLAPTGRAGLHLAAAALIDDEWAALRHRAAAVATTDESLASELEAFARRESERGAWARASASLVAASRLSLERAKGNQRLLEAVDSMLLAGDAAQATTFVDEISSFPGSAMRDCVLGFLAMLGSRPAVAERLLRSAWELADGDADQRLVAAIARRNALHQLYRLRGQEAVEWSRRPLKLVGPRSPGRVIGEMLPLGVGLAYSGRLREGLTEVEQAMAASGVSARQHGVSLRRVRGWLYLVSGDLDLARRDLAEEASEAVRVGSLGSGAFAYANLALAEYLAGAWDDAALHGERAWTITLEIEHTIFHTLATMAAVVVPAARGDWDLVENYLRTVETLPAGYEHNTAAIGVAGAHLGAARGDHLAVVEALEPLSRITPRDGGVDEPGCWLWEDLYGEALIGVGRLDDARAFLDQHEGLAAARGRRFVSARLGRARGRLEASLGDHDAASATFARSLQQLAEDNLQFDRAQVELAWGQALRRRGRRREAAERLVSARELFGKLLARPYVERCDSELAACGLQPVRRGTAEEHRLTPQELSVARLVAAGHTNRQVASELMLSVRTVESHLTRIYAKLRISSRTQLVTRLIT